jgi:hypothetical protein
MGYQQIDDKRRAAEQAGNIAEAQRLARLMRRLDEQRAAYGRAQREA